MRMTEKEEKLVDWAVGELKNAPDPVLPEGFLLRFEQSLKQEVATTQSYTPSQPHWSRSLAAAVLMMCCLAAMYWLGPGLSQPSAGELAVAACPGQVLLDGLAVSQVTELRPSQTLETDEEKALVVSSDSRNRIVVGERTKVVVGKKSRTTELELADGSISVSEMTMKIAVRTPELLIVPVGTEYRVNRGADATEVAVLSGEVRLESFKPSEKVSVRAGEWLLWKHGEPLQPSMVKKLGQEQGESLSSDFSWAQRLRRRPGLGNPFPHFLRAGSSREKQDSQVRRAASRKQGTKSEKKPELKVERDYPTREPRRAKPERRRRPGTTWKKPPQRRAPEYRPSKGRNVRRRPEVVRPAPSKMRKLPDIRLNRRLPGERLPNYRTETQGQDGRVPGVKPPMREIPSYRNPRKSPSTRRPFQRSREDFKNRTTYKSRNEDFKNRTSYGRANRRSRLR